MNRIVFIEEFAGYDLRDSCFGFSLLTTVTSSFFFVPRVRKSAAVASNLSEEDQKTTKKRVEYRNTTKIDKFKYPSARRWQQETDRRGRWVGFLGEGGVEEGGTFFSRCCKLGKKKAKKKKNINDRNRLRRPTDEKRGDSDGPPLSPPSPLPLKLCGP